MSGGDADSDPENCSGCCRSVSQLVSDLFEGSLNAN